MLNGPDHYIIKSLLRRKRGLSSGTYTVRVWSDNGEEDSMTLMVPDFETWIRTKQQEELKSQTILLGKETKREIKNNDLQFVNEMGL
jgi:hypothetical protein